MKLRKRKQQIADEDFGLSLRVDERDIDRNFDSEIIEGLRYLINRMQNKGNFPKRLSVVAAFRKEGVSYISQALAATLAHDMNYQICLVDLNLWWPDDFFQNQDLPSLFEILEGEHTYEEAILQTNYNNLHIFHSGEIPRRKRPVLAKSEKLANFIDELSEMYDYLILDIPAILATTDSVSLASLGKAICLVIQQGVTQVGDVSQALDEIEHLEIIGSVLNKVRFSTPKPITKLLTNW